MSPGKAPALVSWLLNVIDQKHWPWENSAKDFRAQHLGPQASYVLCRRKSDTYFSTATRIAKRWFSNSNSNWLAFYSKEEFSLLFHLFISQWTHIFYFIQWTVVHVYRYIFLWSDLPRFCSGSLFELPPRSFWHLLILSGRNIPDSSNSLSAPALAAAISQRTPGSF